MVGFFDGMELGQRFSYWGLRPENMKGSVPILKSFDEMRMKYMQDVTNLQISDGLTKFYEDYRNRSIIVYNAVWLVLNSIAGKPEKEMETMIENFRKNAR
jgi:hypothetical protein